MQKEIAATWERIRSEASAQAESNPLAAKILNRFVLSRSSLAESLAAILAARLGGSLAHEDELEPVFLRKFSRYPALLHDAVRDLNAVISRDPACSSLVEPLLFFKGFQAIQAHRVAHQLWKADHAFLAKLVQSLASEKFGVDIHPAAVFGHSILLDHATGLVVGETARVGNDVSILHGVSLAGTGKQRGDRHPKVGDGVMIGAHAQLLGNIRIGRGAKVGAGAVVLKDVAAHSTVAGVPAVKIGKPNVDMPSLDMSQDFTSDI